MVEDTYGVHNVKLPAGHMVLYPATSLHQVRPVTRGARLASFFWIQSMVRDDGQRTVRVGLPARMTSSDRDVDREPGKQQVEGRACDKSHPRDDAEPAAPAERMRGVVHAIARSGRRRRCRHREDMPRS